MYLIKCLNVECSLEIDIIVDLRLSELYLS